MTRNEILRMCERSIVAKIVFQPSFETGIF